MKKTIITALLAISMAACTNQQQAQRCELFGVSLGMERDEVCSILIERFGKGESYGKDGSFYYEDIFYDGIKYSNVDFGFVEGKLSHIFCHCDKSVEFANIEKYEDNTAATVTGSINNAYLQGQGQTAGIRSYDLVTDLTVAYYKKNIK